MKYRIVSKHKLSSDWLPPEAFTDTYTSRSTAVAIAIEGIDYPDEQQVLVVDENGEVVWDSLKEEYE